MTALEPDDLARIGYEAYGNVVEWKNFRGDDMPAWYELPGKIQQAWAEAAVAVAVAARWTNGG